MKNKNIVAFTRFLAFLLAMVSAMSCSQRDNPVETSAPAIEQTPRLIMLPKVETNNLSKGDIDLAFVTVESGGTLSLAARHGKVTVTATLNVPAGSVSRNVVIFGYLDPKYLAVAFFPSGLRFKQGKPAVLDFEAKGLGLSPGADVKLYYIDGNTYMQIPANISVDSFGNLRCQAYIQHFSRYAFGF